MPVRRSAAPGWSFHLAPGVHGLHSDGDSMFAVAHKYGECGGAATLPFPGYDRGGWLCGADSAEMGVIPRRPPAPRARRLLPSAPSQLTRTPTTSPGPQCVIEPVSRIQHHLKASSCFGVCGTPVSPSPPWSPPTAASLASWLPSGPPTSQCRPRPLLSPSHSETHQRCKSALHRAWKICRLAKNTACALPGCSQ